MSGSGLLVLQVWATCAKMDAVLNPKGTILTGLPAACASLSLIGFVGCLDDMKNDMKNSEDSACHV